MEKVEDITPLTDLQNGLFLHELLEKNSDNYFIQNIIHVENVDVDKLRKAWNFVANQYDIIRSFFTDRGINGVVRCVVNKIEVPFSVYDWRDNRDINEFIYQDRNRGFNVIDAPLMRISLLQTSDNKYVMIWSFHHLILDGWSSAIVWEEVIQTYEHLLTNLPPKLEIRRPPFRNYVGWLKKKEKEPAIQFWKNYLDDIETSTELSLTSTKDQHDTKVEKVNTSSLFRNIETIETTLCEESGNSMLQWKNLMVLCRDNRITLNTAILGCLGVVIHQYVRSGSIVIGTTISGRDIDLLGVEEIVGVLINTVPIKMTISNEMKMIDVLKRVQQDIGLANQYGYLPLQDLLKWSNHRKLFDMLFLHENYPIHKGANSIIFSHPKVIERTEYPLTIDSYVENEKLKFRFSFDSILFKKSEILRLFLRLKKALLSLRDSLFLQIKQIDFSTEEEKQQIFQKWNNSVMEYPREKSISELFEEQVKRTPDAVAVVCGNKHLTYNALNNKANQLADYLRKLGTNNEDLVGLCLDRSMESLVGMLGILKAGGVYVPFDPTCPKERIKYMVSDATITTVITTDKYINKFNKLPNINIITFDQIKGSSENVKTDISPDNLAYVIYTSGSTGRPKGAQVTHTGAVNHLMIKIKDVEIGKNSIVAQTSRLSFDVSIWQNLSAIFCGGTTVIIDDNNVLNNLPYQVYKFQITQLEIVPNLFELLLGKKTINEMSSLKYLLLTGEALRSEPCIKWFKASKIPLVNAYGPTECSDDVTHYVLRKSEDAAGQVVSVGTALSNLQVLILSENLSLTPIGGIGEICVTGVGVGRGYLNRPGLTAEKFIANPFGNGDRLYRTGDLGRYLHDGNIEFLGRIDNQVKIRGFRVELNEIETAIRKCKFVKSAAVVINDEDKSKQLVACIIPQKTYKKYEEFTMKLSEKIKLYTGKEVVDFINSIQEEISLILPEYMVPSYYVVMDKMPTTINGKIDGKTIVKLCRKNLIKVNNYAPPTSDIEEQLCLIWQRVLQNNNIGITDNFFKLGGDSILAISVVSKAQKQGIIFSVKDLLEQKNIKKLAQVSKKVSRNEVEYILDPLEILPIDPKEVEQKVRLKVKKAYPLSKMQEGIMFSAMYGENDVYFIQNVSIVENINRELLQQAWQLTAKYFDILTAGVLIDDDIGNIIYIPENATIPFKFIDYSEERQSKIYEFLVRDRNIIFNKFPLMRVTLIKTSSEYIMIWSFHHAILDGWSTAIVLEKLFQIYEQLTKKDKITTTNAYGFENYIAWLKYQDRDTDIEWWKKYLGNVDFTTQLTFKNLILEEKSNYRSIEFSMNNLQEIEQYCKNCDITIGTFSLGVVGLIIGKYLSQREIVLGMTVSGRDIPIPNIEKMVGLFINTIPIKMNFSNIRMTDFFKQLQLDVQTLSEKSHVSLSKLLKGKNLFNVLFVYENYPINRQAIEKSSLKLKNVIGIERTEYPLAIVTYVSGNKLKFKLLYQTKHFNAKILSRLFNHLEKAMNTIVKNSKIRPNEVDTLTSEEHQRLFFQNNTNNDFQKDKCINELFEKQVEKTPDAVAVTYKNKYLTYNVLNSRANQLAHYLRKCGANAEIPFGVDLERSTNLVVAILGILKAGGVYVPLSKPNERINYIKQNSGVQTIITESYLKNDEIWEEGEKNISAVDPQNLAYIIYTSGSTGTPKGVQITHCSFVNRLLWMKKEYEIEVSDRVLQKTSISFDVSLWELFLPLISGATMDLLPPGEQDNPEAIKKEINRKQITIIHFVPSMLEVFINEVGNLKEIKHLISSGETLKSNLFKKITSDASNLYGPTETTIDSIYYRKKDAGHISVPIGYPIANTKVYLLDVDMNPVPAGVLGEIYIGGVGIARGYLNHPELTAEKFIANPFGNGDRLYRTGDFGRYLFDGTIEFWERIDNQVKIRGFRVELGEIEYAIQNCKNVKSVALVIRRENDTKQIVACVVPEKAYKRYQELYTGTSEKIKMYAGAKVIDFVKSIREKISSVLPDYMLPSSFVVIDRIPTTVNGKINDKFVVAMYKKSITLENSHIPPKSNLEKQLCNILQEVLHVDNIGITDNFFKLGGDSILAIAVVSKAKKKGLHFSVKDLFDLQTIDKLKKIITVDKEKRREQNRKAFELLPSTVTIGDISTLLDGGNK